MTKSLVRTNRVWKSPAKIFKGGVWIHHHICVGDAQRGTVLCLAINFYFACHCILFTEVDNEAQRQKQKHYAPFHKHEREDKWDRYDRPYSEPTEHTVEVDHDRVVKHGQRLPCRRNDCVNLHPRAQMTLRVRALTSRGRRA